MYLYKLCVVVLEVYEFWILETPNISILSLIRVRKQVGAPYLGNFEDMSYISELWLEFYLG